MSGENQAQRVETVSGLSEEAFVKDYLKPGKPVVVENAINDWPAMGQWNASSFSDRFGDLEIGLQGDFFGDVMRMRFRDYCSLINEQEPRSVDDFSPDETVPYLRYSNFVDVAHKQLRDEWSRPDFLPARGYVFPRGDDSPTVRKYPEFGIYVSPRGAATRFHVDGGYDNGILCQVQGQKVGLLYSPDQQQKWKHLFPPPSNMKPDTARSIAAMRGDLHQQPGLTGWHFDLHPGSVLFIPKRWAHEVYTTSASISVAYNFIHSADVDWAWRWFHLFDANRQRLFTLRRSIKRAISRMRRSRRKAPIPSLDGA